MHIRLRRSNAALAATGIFMLVAAICPQMVRAFEKIALIDSYDFAHAFDIELNSGTEKILDFVLKTGAETLLWRNQGGGNVRYPSVENPKLEDPLEKWRIPCSTIYGWTRLEKCETNHLAYALQATARRGVTPGIHHTLEQTHYIFSSTSAWNFNHPQFWCHRKGGTPWAGRCSIAFEKVLEHRLKMVDEMIAMGGDVFYFDIFRDSRWDPSFEFVEPVCRQWRELYGCEPPDDPSDERWTRLVSRHFHRFMREIRKRLDASGRKIRFLVAISRVRGIDRDDEWRLHAFDWRALAAEGVFDGLVADGISPDPKDPWGSTRRAYEWVVGNSGKAKVYFHCSEYDNKQNGVPTYMRLTGLSKGDTARRLLETARDAGGAGVVLECVDPHLYGEEIDKVLREFK